MGGGIGDWIGLNDAWKLEAHERFEIAGWITFGGVMVPDGVAESDAAAYLRRFTTEPDHFELIEGRYALVGRASEDV